MTSTGAPSAAADLRTRLQSYSRYVALVAEQLEALERGDATRARELEEERAGLESTLSDAEGDPLTELLDEGLVAVEEQLAEEERLNLRWASLEDGALRITRSFRLWPIKRGQYLQGDAPPAQLDLRF